MSEQKTAATTNPEPVRLPLSREEALERWKDWHCGETAASGAEEDMAALAAAWGIAFAPEPPAPPKEAEPPAWYDKPILVEESEETPGFHYLSGAEGEFVACGGCEGLPWLARSHDRRLELELNIEEQCERIAELEQEIRHGGGGVEIYGVKMTLTEAVERYGGRGVTTARAAARINRHGWSTVDAVTEPTRPTGRPPNGELYRNRSAQ